MWTVMQCQETIAHEFARPLDGNVHSALSILSLPMLRFLKTFSAKTTVGLHFYYQRRRTTALQTVVYTGTTDTFNLSMGRSHTW